MNQSSPAQSGKVIPSGSRLECFCPHCASSLVEGEHLRLEMLNGRGERGTLLLSPFLNVFDSSSTLQEGKGEEAQDLFCPHCRASLKDMARRCEACGSAAARFHAEIDDERIDFFICLRKDCHWHGISEKARSRLILEAEGFHDPVNSRQLIRSGTRLHCACPHCQQEISKGDDLTVAIRTVGGHDGVLTLSPHLNNFRAECSIETESREELATMSCPLCGHELISDERHCELCGARAARFEVRTSRGNVSFYICLRRQCHWHGLDDEARARLELE